MPCHRHCVVSRLVERRCFLCVCSVCILCVLLLLLLLLLLLRVGSFRTLHVCHTTVSQPCARVFSLHVVSQFVVCPSHAAAVRAVMSFFRRKKSPSQLVTLAQTHLQTLFGDGVPDKEAAKATADLTDRLTAMRSVFVGEGPDKPPKQELCDELSQLMQDSGLLLSLLEALARLDFDHRRLTAELFVLMVRKNHAEVAEKCVLGSVSVSVSVPLFRSLACVASLFAAAAAFAYTNNTALVQVPA